MSEQVHPEPTVAVVKALYGRAFRCAHPECQRPLYKQDNDTGDLVLNSRVAHIHARRSGGPRWKPMTSEENRHPSNLLLLCIEHSYEVDERPELFPAEALGTWKQAQLAEYEHVQRSWPLSDSDAGRVIEASSSKSADRIHSDAIAGTVRAVERLALAVKEGRRGPASVAAAWRATRDAARASFVAWDQDGAPIYMEPSRIETQERQTALELSLRQTTAELTPLASEAKVELAAVRESRPAARPWCESVARQVDLVIVAASRWPGPPELEDDGGLDLALVEMSKAISSLTAFWRGDPAGDPAVAPPERTPSDSSDQRAADPLQAHRELLELARPYSRVDHHSYNADLRSRLATAAQHAATLPPVLSTISIDLSATCRLAAKVARNATDDELGRIIDQDRSRRPLCAAVKLLEETGRLVEDQGREVTAALARDALVGVWEATDWSDPLVWQGNDVYGEVIFWAASRVTSEAKVRAILARALVHQSAILRIMVVACAPWEEKYDNSELLRAVRVTRRYRTLPPWFPIEAVTDAAAKIVPQVAPAEHPDGADDTESLIAQVLYLAQTHG